MSNAYVLVVDDNEMNRDMLSRRLIRKGYDVDVACDGFQALEMIDNKPPDLILLDIMMPGMSGLEVLEKVRERHAQTELPIIMATAKTGSEDVVQALDNGANDYVTKPIDFPILLARVQTQLRNRAPRRTEGAVGVGVAIVPGSVIENKFRLEDQIGRGNFGSVWRGHHLQLGLKVAVKILDTRFMEGEEALKRFQREGITACKVQHPNAVKVFDFGITDGGVAYLVMELLEGESLRGLLNRQPVLELERALGICQLICSALAAAHEAGIIHRDIKPANIHLTTDGEVKVLDFGIAQISSEAGMEQRLTLDGSILGTPAYMAPERFSGAPYDGRADVYSVGIMLFELLTGKLPFGDSGSEAMAVAMMHLRKTPPRIRALRGDIPREIEVFLDQLLAKKSEDRPSSQRVCEVMSQMIANPVWTVEKEDPSLLDVTMPINTAVLSKDRVFADRSTKDFQLQEPEASARQSNTTTMPPVQQEAPRKASAEQTQKALRQDPADQTTATQIPVQPKLSSSVFGSLPTGPLPEALRAPKPERPAAPSLESLRSPQSRSEITTAVSLDAIEDEDTEDVETGAVASALRQAGSKTLAAKPMIQTGRRPKSFLEKIKEKLGLG